MPVKIGDKKYSNHARAVAAIRRKKPEIADPHAYVAVIERNQRKGKGGKKK
jgi:hypothetical protein